MKITIDVEFVKYIESDDKDIVARVYYPDEDEGTKIIIKKGLSRLEVNKSIHHEIGHLLDWYISNGEQSDDQKIKEEIAKKIGESIRRKKDSDEV